MRIKFPREGYYPDDAVAVDCNGTDAAVFTYTRNGNVCAVAFHGRALKPDWQYRFRSIDDRDKRIHDFIDGRKVRAESMAKYKADRTKARALQVGDILESSWGYDQTNVDFYEVTALIGKLSVDLRTLAQSSTSTGDMTGHCTPRPGVYTSPPVTKRVTNGGTVKVRSFAWARPWDGKPERWSSYA